MRVSLAAAAALLLVGACGPIGSSTTAASASSVAVQSSDLPSGMHRCDLSSDIGTYLKNIQATDPTTYASTKSSWDNAKKNGATAAQIAFYADSDAHCASLKSNGSQVGTATFKLVVNVVLQFKDEASAAKGYTTNQIFGFSPSSLKATGMPVTEGTKTGLSANSIVLQIPLGAQTIYVAVWQNKAFMVILGVLNIDPSIAKKVATAENSRIH